MNKDFRIVGEVHEVDFLQTNRNEQWQVTGEDVVVNPATNRNF